jgi:hypothetical protein
MPEERRSARSKPDTRSIPHGQTAIERGGPVRFRLEVWRRRRLAAHSHRSRPFDLVHDAGTRRAEDRAMRRLAVAFSTAVVLAGAALACGSKRLPEPAYVGHPTSALVQVPYPPPPARVEFIPDKPNDEAVWIDGEWVWQGRRYGWKPGRWVVPPREAAFAPWTAVRDMLGTLYVAEGAWRDRKGNELPPPPILGTGAPSQGAVTYPEGEQVQGQAAHPADASTTKSDAEAGTEATHAPRDLIVDSGLLPPPDAQLFPEGGLEPSEGGFIPDATFVDTGIFDNDASPNARRRGGARMETKP